MHIFYLYNTATFTDSLQIRYMTLVTVSSNELCATVLSTELFQIDGVMF